VIFVGSTSVLSGVTRIPNLVKFTADYNSQPVVWFFDDSTKCNGLSEDAYRFLLYPDGNYYVPGLNNCSKATRGSLSVVNSITWSHNRDLSELDLNTTNDIFVVETRDSKEYIKTLEQLGFVQTETTHIDIKGLSIDLTEMKR
jgi:hypothetical protein